MSSDISLLPEDLRRGEEELKGKKSAPTASEREDVEVIEVDEGEVGDVLSSEPWLSRAVFSAQSFLEGVRALVFHPRVATPPKLPPQFFSPPTKAQAPGLVPIAGAELAAPARPAPPAARPIPADATRRVRVIKRVRKPVRVSFLDEQEWQMMADIPRRKFTLILTFIIFVALGGGGYILLERQYTRSHADLTEVQSRLQSIQEAIVGQEQQWTSYRDLEPRLKQLRSLLDAHVAPTALFDALERATVPTVYYTGMSLTPNGAVTLAAIAPNFDDAAKQVVALRSAGFARTVDAFGYHAEYAADGARIERVTFQISIALDRTFLSAMTRVSPTPRSP